MLLKSKVKKMIKVIAFDLDDTLYSEREYVLSGFGAVSKLIEGRFGIKDFYPVLIEIFNGGERKKTFDITLKRFGIKYDEALVQDMVNHYRAHFPNIRPYDDVVPTLQHLRQKHHLGLITDGYLQVQKKKMRALNIQRLFERIIYTDEYGKNYWKPSPLPYRLVMKHFSVEGNKCAYVGDNLEKDFIAPNQMDWLTIQIKRKEGQYSDRSVKDDHGRPRIRIKSLRELEIILERKQ